RMVTEWGMSEKLGPIAYGSSGPVFLGRDYEERNIYSEETAGLIDAEVKKIIMAQYERAKKLLSENREILDNMARVLVERETIYTDEVDMLMSGKDYKEVLAYMEQHDSGAPDSPFGRKFENTPAGAAVKSIEESDKDSAGLTKDDNNGKSEE
ncbi:MAG: hypothetical protein K2L87_01505, partial [Clostridiales bacterium]|nr:hypothetical protein [Clostridiales bacterium]